MTSPSKDTVRVEHTPMPWRVYESKTIGIEGPNGHIATLEDYPETEADAALIVRAVNAHDDLVKALETAVAYVEKAAYTRPKTPSRIQAKHTAQKDLENICATLSRIKTEG